MQKILSLILFLFLHSTLVSQTILIETEPYSLNDIDSYLFNKGDSREIIDLRQDWRVYEENNSENFIQASVPCTFKNTNALIFEKDFTISDELISGYDLSLNCLGINYHADIMLNEVVIFKKDVANVPLTIDLPVNLISSQSPNILKIIVYHELDDTRTIPSLQRFLFPQNNGGITRDIYIELLPKVHVKNLEISSSLDFERNTSEIFIEGTVKNASQPGDTSITASIEILNRLNQAVAARQIEIDPEQPEFSFDTEINIANSQFWSPGTPNSYVCRVNIFRNGNLTDSYNRKLSLYKLNVDQSNILLNGKPFNLMGTAYVTPAYSDFSSNHYSKIEEDLSIIKEAGFNSVRFAKSAPHPYALEYCESIGLLAFIELPLNSIPEEILNDQNYRSRVKEIADSYLENYKDYSSVAAIGLGSSFLPDSPASGAFLSSLSEQIKSNTPYLIYASFVGVNKSIDTGLDLEGLEIYSKAPAAVEDNYGEAKLFISDAVYPNYKKGQNGYLYQYSYEAQAKFIENIIDLSDKSNIDAYFLGSMYDYRGDFTSLYTNFAEDNKYSIGILDDDKNTNRISFSVLKSKQTNSERTTIPIGSKNEDAPLFIVFTGLVLAIFMGLLINSKKKFRSDATRALLRPYNFFADIRDHRILSGMHTILLMIILAGSHALLLVNLMYYLKNNVLVEKILIAFGVPSWIHVFSYLAWNPVTAFIYTFILSIIMFFALAVLIKGASFFIKTKILLINIYYVVIWAFLPMTILLPVKLILYRLLIAEIFNTFIYVFLVLYAVWLVSRVLKGIYVIFDVSKGSVYFYSTALFLIVVCGTLFYFQFTNSTIYFIVNAYKQFLFM